MRLDHLLSKEEENRSRRFKRFYCSILRELEINGGLAQLGEHLLCKQGVKGSIPLISTNRALARKGLIAQLVRALG